MQKLRLPPEKKKKKKDLRGKVLSLLLRKEEQLNKRGIWSLEPQFLSSSVLGNSKVQEHLVPPQDSGHGYYLQCHCVWVLWTAPFSRQM